MNDQVMLLMNDSVHLAVMCDDSGEKWVEAVFLCEFCVNLGTV